MPIAKLASVNMHFRTVGSGNPVLLFVHGGYCSLNDWKDQASDLSDEFQVIAIDQRGHGRSSGRCGDFTLEQSARDINDFIDDMAFAPAVLIGHSLGTRIVMEVAAARPDNVKALVLLDGSRLRSAPPESAAQTPKMSEEQIRNFMVTAFAAMFCETIDPSVMTQISHKIASERADDIMSFFHVVETWDVERMEATLDRIKARIPVLAIQSTYHDHATPRRSLSVGESSPYLDLLKRHLNRLEVAIAPGLGHFNMMEAPSLINAHIRHFAHRMAAVTTA